jgi:hypothetical protein
MERGGIFVDGGKPQSFNITGTVEKGLQQGSLPLPERLRVNARLRVDTRAHTQAAPLIFLVGVPVTHMMMKRQNF